MNIITTTALSNFRKNKNRNILIGIAIALTALLLTIVPTTVMGALNVQFGAVNKVYPTFHGMYRNVDKKAADKIKTDERVEAVGLREDPAYMYCEDSDATIIMIASDSIARKLTKMELEEGKVPEKADEIVVSKGLLGVMGLTGHIGDTIEVPFQPVTKEGLGLVQTKEFTITGFTKDADKNTEASGEGIYSAVVSMEFADEVIPENERAYRVYVRLADAEGMVTDIIENNLKDIGESYGIADSDIVNNGEYLYANYVDPALYSGIAIILLAVVFAGVITIYSIYYVSMLDKVQEYGKLRAIGATKRQIRKLVFREGFAVAVISIPVGICAGLAGGVLLIRKLVDSSMVQNNILAEQMKLFLENGEVHLIKWWIIVLAAAVSLLTVYVSLLRPMQTAGKVSAIEAIRYQGEGKTKKKNRKGYEEINTAKLTLSNLGRNKKRTAVTISTLGITGILFMVVATVLSCMNPEVMAREAIRSDIRVEIDFDVANEMHPERELYRIQQENPLTEHLREQIEHVPGVTSVEESCYVWCDIEELREEDGTPLQTGMKGLSASAMKDLKKYVTEGDLDSQSMKDGSGIIIAESIRDGRYGGNSSKWKIGDKVHVRLHDGEEIIAKEYEITAVADAPLSLTGYVFSMPDETLRNSCSTNVAYAWDIMTEKGKEESAAEEIKTLIEGQDTLDIGTYREQYKLAEKIIGYMMYGCYSMLLVFGLIGILNLINTMINSVYVRKKELGMLQVIGMSERQTMNMLQLEGLFYTAGTLALSLGIGSILGYVVFLWAKAEGLMSIRIYQYPVIPAVVLVLVVLVVQIVVTGLVNKSFKKQSLIERVRFAE